VEWIIDPVEKEMMVWVAARNEAEFVHIRPYAGTGSASMIYDFLSSTEQNSVGMLHDFLFSTVLMPDGLEMHEHIQTHMPSR
jgi:hypothetical protein